MADPGTIAPANYPDPLPTGLIETLEAAPMTVARAPDGLLVSDLAAALTIISAYAGSAAELAFNKSSAQAALDARYTSVIVAGCQVTIGGVAKAYQIDPVSLTNINGAYASAVANLIPSGFAWCTADNTMVPMTQAQVMTFGQTVAAYYIAINGAYFGLKSAINGAATMTELAMIIVGTGWPANSG